MTKKELTLLRVTGLNAALYLKWQATLEKEDNLLESGERYGILRTVYLLSPTEYTRICAFVDKHFPVKYRIYGDDYYEIADSLQEDYFKQYKL